MQRVLTVTITSAITCLLAWAVLVTAVSTASAASTQLTVLAAVPNSSVGAYEYVHMVWDQKPDPPKLQVRWTTPNLRFAGRPGVVGGVQLEPQAQAAVAAAVRYAIERTPQVSHTGTITMM